MNKNTLLIEFSKYLKIIVSGAIILTGLGISYFITYSNYKIYNKFLQDIEAQKNENSKLESRVSQLDKIKRIASTIESTDVLAKQAIPNEVEIPIVMSLIQKITTESGVKLGKLSYSGSYLTTYAGANKPVSTSGAVLEGTEPESSLETANTLSPEATGKKPAILEDAIKIQGSVSGKLPSLINFLKSVETSRKLLEISNITYGALKVSEDVNTDLGYELRFIVSSFYKDFSMSPNSIPLTIDFDKYKDLISTLNSYKYTEIDLSKVDIGKSDPFSSSSKSSNQDDTNINSIEPSSGLNGSDSESSEINVVEIEGTGSTVSTDTTTDTEASPTSNITGTLMDILKKEGVSP